MTNQQIANELLNQARQWSKTNGNLFRVRAYRRAAMAVMGLRREAADLLRSEGKAGLIDVPGIGSHLAEDIAEFLRRGERFAGRMAG